MRKIIVQEFDLSEIITRLNCCHAILLSLCMQVSEENGSACADAFFGAADLLDSITRKFETYVNAAVTHHEPAGNGQQQPTPEQAQT